MMKGAGIKLEAGILEWASKGHDIDALSKKFSHFNAWLNGDAYPTFTQLEKLAKYLDFPFGYFFLSKPLELEKAENIDFRTIKNKLNAGMSANLKRIVENMQYLQDWKKDYCIRNQLDKVNLAPRSECKENVDMLVDYIYKILDVPDNWFEKYKNFHEAFNYIRGKMEEKRIIVVVTSKIDDNTHRTFDIEEFRAFALFDDYAPLIFINAQDAPSGRLFSLIHEFVHILRGETDVIGESHFFIETFCNSVAIQFLAPENYIKARLRGKQITKDILIDMSNYFNISFEAICYRLCTLNYISRTECNTYINENKLKVSEKKKKGGSYWNTKLSVLSPYVARAIISELYNGNVTYTECFKMLGITGLKTFKKFEKKLT